MNAFVTDKPKFETNGSFQPEWRATRTIDKTTSSNNDANNNNCWRTENQNIDSSKQNWRSEMGSDTLNEFNSNNTNKMHQPRKPRTRNRKKHDEEEHIDDFVMLTAQGKIDYDYVYTGVASPGSYEIRRCDLPKDLL